jgi:hypothetical protein
MSKKPTPPVPAPAANDPRSMILNMLQRKSGMKQDVYHRTLAFFWS